MGPILESSAWHRNAGLSLRLKPMLSPEEDGMPTGEMPWWWTQAVVRSVFPGFSLRPGAIIPCME